MFGERGQALTRYVIAEVKRLENAGAIARPSLTFLDRRFTIERAFYPTALARHHNEAVLPRPAERTTIHDLYVNELSAARSNRCRCNHRLFIHPCTEP